MDSETQLYINNLANRYIKNGDEVVFSTLYKTLSDELGLRLKYWIDTVYLAESHDILEMFDDAILKVLKKMNKDGFGEFSKLFNTVLSNDYRSLLRKIRTKRKWEDFDDGSGVLSRLVISDDYKLEEIKTDADKRQLINVLTENCDPLTTAIVNEYLIDGLHKPTAIGRKLGVHHSKVTRQLHKLSRKYNEVEFGDIDAYLVC